jgi:hypothetical protein
MHTYGGLSFYHNSYNMQHDKNQSGNAPTEGKEVTNFKDGSGLSREYLGNGFDYYSKIIENCRISEQTSKFLACIAMLSDLYGCVWKAVESMYGDYRIDEIIGESFQGEYTRLESVLYNFLKQSVGERLGDEIITEI